MNDAAASPPVEQQFATAVKNFVPQASRKHQQLLTVKSGIAELRHKGASYRIIAEILCSSGVTVSHTTVARFCHDVLPLCYPPRSVPAHRRRKASFPTRNTTDSGGRTVATDGPRVADPKNI